jgi:hypothetical protein
MADPNSPKLSVSAIVSRTVWTAFSKAFYTQKALPRGVQKKAEFLERVLARDKDVRRELMGVQVTRHD